MARSGRTSIRRFERYAVRAITGVLWALYPFVIYILITLWGVRTAGFFMLAAVLLTAGRRLLWNRLAARSIAIQVVGIGGIIALSVILNDARYMMQVPVLISLFLLTQFAWSFHRPPVMVERFAVALQGDVRPEEIPYCRHVTAVWIVFFACNAIVAEWTALFGSTETWALYNGFISYLIMGIIFTVEFIIRRKRFRRFGKGWVDTILRACMYGRNHQT